MDRHLRKKKIMTGILLCLLIAVYIMIFSFSADDADASSSLSVAVTRKLMNLYYRLTGSNNNPIAVAPALVNETEAVVRKLAHFTEYMAVGFLSFGIAVMWIRSRIKGIGAIILQVFLSAGIDEFHQYFVPGRYASFRDVLIDIAGGIAGILFMLLISGIRKQRR